MVNNIFSFTLDEIEQSIKYDLDVLNISPVTDVDIYALYKTQGGGYALFTYKQYDVSTGEGKEFVYQGNITYHRISNILNKTGKE